MRTLSFTVKQGETSTCYIPAKIPAGTLVAKFYYRTTRRDPWTERAGVVSIGTDRFVLSIDPDDVTAISSCYYQIGLTVNGGTETIVASGEIDVDAGEVKPRFIMSPTKPVLQNGDIWIEVL